MQLRPNPSEVLANLNVGGCRFFAAFAYILPRILRKRCVCDCQQCCCQQVRWDVTPESNHQTREDIDGLIRIARWPPCLKWLLGLSMAFCQPPRIRTTVQLESRSSANVSLIQLVSRPVAAVSQPRLPPSPVDIRHVGWPIPPVPCHTRPWRSDQPRRRSAL